MEISVKYKTQGARFKERRKRKQDTGYRSKEQRTKSIQEKEKTAMSCGGTRSERPGFKLLVLKAYVIATNSPPSNPEFAESVSYLH